MEQAEKFETLEERLIDPEQLIDEAPISSVQWTVVALCFITATLDGYDIRAMSFVAPLLTEQFGLTPVEMGYIFSSGLFGLMIGTFTFSVVADITGRKRVLVGSCLVVGLFAMLTATATSFEEFVAYRFLMGLGLGAAMPNLNAQTSEYAPKRRRALLMTLMFVGFSLGQVFGAYLSVGLINVWGWPSVFIFAGSITICLGGLLFMFLPESIATLTRRDPNSSHVKEILQSISKDYQPSAKDRFVSNIDSSERPSPILLFKNNRTPVTLCFWLVFFTNLLTLYALGSWLPTILTDAGMTLEDAISASAVMEAGGVAGGLALAWIVDRRGPSYTLPVAFATGMVLLLLFGVVEPVVFTITMLALGLGLCVTGAQFVLNALAGLFYPVEIRSTGLGWCLAVGRIGAIAGPLIIGAILSAGLDRGNLFDLVAGFTAVSAVSSLVLIRLFRHRLQPHQINAEN